MKRIRYTEEFKAEAIKKIIFKVGLIKKGTNCSGFDKTKNVVYSIYLKTARAPLTFPSLSKSGAKYE